LITVSGFRVFAQTVYTLESIPKPYPPQSYVSNPDGILSSVTESDLNTTLRRLEDSTTVQIAVVIVHSIGNEVPGDFRTELFRYWGVGQRENNNGLLILLVLDQRRMEFEVGYGLEGILTDIMSKHIQETFMVPLAREGDFDGAVSAGVAQVTRILMDPKYREEVYAESISNSSILPFWRREVPGALLVVFGVFYLLFSVWNFNTRKKALKKAPAYVKTGFNDAYNKSKFTLLNLALPAGLFAWQEISGVFRQFEFWLLLYGLFAVLLLEKRLRVNRYIHKDGAENVPQETYNVLARSHSKGWLAATIFFPLPFIIYNLIRRGYMQGLRNTAPVAADGIKMIRLDEKIDDGFLNAFQLKEENLRSMDYDVWKHPDTNEVKVFSFENFFSKYKTCPSCSAKAFHMTKNVTLVSPTYTSTGTGEKTYTCKACLFEERKQYTIAKRTSSSSSGSGGGFSGGGGGGGFGGGSSGGGGAGSSW